VGAVLSTFDNLHAYAGQCSCAKGRGSSNCPALPSVVEGTLTVPSAVGAIMQRFNMRWLLWVMQGATFMLRLSAVLCLFKYFAVEASFGVRRLDFRGVEGIWSGYRF